MKSTGCEPKHLPVRRAMGSLVLPFRSVDAPTCHALRV